MGIDIITPASSATMSERTTMVVVPPFRSQRTRSTSSAAPRHSSIVASSLVTSSTRRLASRSRTFSLHLQAMSRRCCDGAPRCGSLQVPSGCTLSRRRIRPRTDAIALRLLTLPAGNIPERDGPVAGLYRQVASTSRDQFIHYYGLCRQSHSRLTSKLLVHHGRSSTRSSLNA